MIKDAFGRKAAYCKFKRGIEVIRIIMNSCRAIGGGEWNGARGL